MKEKKKTTFNIKGCFICNFCRNICEGKCDEDLKRLESGIIDDKNRDLENGRKQRIDCLGKFCDQPCGLQDENATPEVETLIRTIKFLGEKCNELIKENEILKNNK